MHVYHNGCDWYVAESIDDAYAARTENDGTSREEQIEWEEFEQCPDEAVLSILVNEEGKIDDHGTPLKLTMAEWVAREGRGILCSTEY